MCVCSPRPLSSNTLIIMSQSREWRPQKSSPLPHKMHVKDVYLPEYVITVNVVSTELCAVVSAFAALRSYVPLVVVMHAARCFVDAIPHHKI
jgi:hypothetical protein